MFERYQSVQLAEFYEELQGRLLPLHSNAGNDSCQELHLDVGMDQIRALEESNALGQSLAKHLKQLMLVMRLSQVLGNSALSVNSFDALYLDMKHKCRKHATIE